MTSICTGSFKAVSAAPAGTSTPSSGSTYETENAAYKLAVQGDALFVQGNYSEAVNVLNQAAACGRTSYSHSIHSSLAMCYRQLKMYDRALAEVKLSLQSSNSDCFPYYIQGLIYYDMEKTLACIESLNKCIGTSNCTHVSEARTMLVQAKSACAKDGTLKLQAGKINEAIKLLEIAATTDPSPNSACIHGNLAYAYREAKQYDKAISAAKKALQYDPRAASTMYNLAITYYEMARFEDSDMWLRRYLTCESDGNNRSNAEQLLSEIVEDGKKFRSADNKLPDYMALLEQGGHAWSWPVEKLPIKIFISSGKDVPGFRPVFRKYAIKALDTWCEASGKKIKYVLLKSSDDADMIIRWTPSALQMDGEHRVVAGLTSVQEDDGKISRAVIGLRTTDAFSPGKYVENGQMASVVMHEVGHALGLDHSNLIYDVMYFHCSKKQSGMPTSRDRKTMARLYGNHPQVNFTPSPESTAAGPPIVFLPPPAFAPPKPNSSDKLVPPMFTPPPLSGIKDKLMPPLFTPPVPSAGKIPSGLGRRITPAPAIPVFMPPPVAPSKKNGFSGNGNLPFFVPPPVKP